MAFIPQNSFEGMRHIHGLFCDFAIFDSSNHPIGVIEFNGKQHYEPVDFAGKGEEWAEKLFVMNQKRDSIKVEFLKDKSNEPTHKINEPETNPTNPSFAGVG